MSDFIIACPTSVWSSLSVNIKTIESESLWKVVRNGSFELNKDKLQIMEKDRSAHSRLCVSLRSRNKLDMLSQRGNPTAKETKNAAKRG